MLKDDLVGKQIGEFHIEARIGRGGMASVYRAYQPSMNRQVALKVIPYDETDGKDEFRRRFAQEAEVVARLEHIHILPVYAYGVAEGRAYLAMRLLSGGSLSDLLTDGALPLDNAAEIFGQIARGLSYAHSKGIIHRDLKPSNILLDDAGNAYLTDFGLAKWIVNAPELTKTGNIVGTPAYMSPEQLRGEVVDHRADIYSMGIILYHMVVGRPPFEISSSDIVSLIYQHLEKIPPAPSEINPEIPQAVEVVIMRALEKNPDLRYNDVRQMADDLDRALGRKVGSTFGTPSPMPRFNPSAPSTKPLTKPSVKPSRLPLFAAIASAVVIALIAGLIIITQNRMMLPPKAVVQIGEVGSASDIIPTDAQINTAKQVLGDGFIAYVTCNQSSEYHATQAREMGDLARQMGLGYRVYDSDTDEYQQLTEIENARTDGAKAIILCPLNAQLLDGSLKSVQDAGIPLVLLSSDIPGYGGVQLVGDEFLLGKKPGELAGQIIRDEMGGQANVIILDYPDLPHIVMRANGLEAGVLEFAPDAKIIGRYLGATREFAEKSVRDLLDQGVEFDVILSINDAGSFGAIAALEAANIPPESVVITSVDAEVQAREYILEGHYIRGSVDPGRAEVSKTAIDIAIQLLAGGTIPEQILAPPGIVMTKELLEAQKQLQ